MSRTPSFCLVVWLTAGCVPPVADIAATLPAHHELREEPSISDEDLRPTLVPEPTCEVVQARFELLWDVDRVANLAEHQIRPLVANMLGWSRWVARGRDGPTCDFEREPRLLPGDTTLSRLTQEALIASRAAIVRSLEDPTLALEALREGTERLSGHTGPNCELEGVDEAFYRLTRYLFELTTITVTVRPEEVTAPSRCFEIATLGGWLSLIEPPEDVPSHFRPLFGDPRADGTSILLMLAGGYADCATKDGAAWCSQPMGGCLYIVTPARGEVSSQPLDQP